MTLAAVSNHTNRAAAAAASSDVRLLLGRV